MIKEKSVVFSAQMVKAVQSGRKTQLRIPIDNIKGFGLVSSFHRSSTPGYDFIFRCRRRLWQDFRELDLLKLCPLGQPGTLLWVRETWEQLEHDKNSCRYRVDHDKALGRWRSATCMPRWASRITLRVKRVWIEQLCDVTEENVRAEGIKARILSFHGYGEETASLVADFRNFWRSAHPDSDWMWACEFEVI